MFFFSLLFFLLGLAAAQSNNYPLCVPSPKLAAPRGPTAFLGQPSKLCCLLTSGLVSCASTEDGGGVVIDLDDDVFGPEAAAAAAVLQPQQRLNETAAWHTQLRFTTPRTRVYFENPAISLTGTMWFVDHPAGIRVVSTRTQRGGGGTASHQRIVALFGFAEAQAGPTVCRKLCKGTVCSPLRLCLTRLHAANTFFVSVTWKFETFFAATVLSPDRANDIIKVAVNLFSIPATVSTTVRLEANPELNRFAVTASWISATMGTSQFAADPFTFDDPGTW
jgi:hypothetical protein